MHENEYLVEGGEYKFGMFYLLFFKHAISSQSVQACARQAAGEQVQVDVMTVKKVGRRLTTDALT